MDNLYRALSVAKMCTLPSNDDIIGLNTAQSVRWKPIKIKNICIRYQLLCCLQPKAW